MTKVIGLVQVKGGACRSTVSTNLAGELSKQGKTVLIDCDMPPGTPASCFVVRKQKGRQGIHKKIRLKAIKQDCTVTYTITKLLEKEVK